MKSTDRINHKRSNRLSRVEDWNVLRAFHPPTARRRGELPISWPQTRRVAGTGQSASVARGPETRRRPPLPSRPPSYPAAVRTDGCDLGHAGSLVCLTVPALPLPSPAPPSCLSASQQLAPLGARRPSPGGQCCPQSACPPPSPPSSPPSSPPLWSRSRVPLAVAPPLSLSDCRRQPWRRRRPLRFTALAPGWFPSELLLPLVAAYRRSLARSRAGRRPASRRGWLASAQTQTTTRRWACRVRRHRRRLRSRFGNSPASTTLYVCLGEAEGCHRGSVARMARAGRQLGLSITPWLVGGGVVAGVGPPHSLGTQQLSTMGTRPLVGVGKDLPVGPRTVRLAEPLG